MDRRRFTLAAAGLALAPVALAQTAPKHGPVGAPPEGPLPAPKEGPVPAPEVRPVLSDGPPPAGPIGRFFVENPSRSDDNRARDAFRHPLESLKFWGLRPGMTVVEIEPSGGYWTEILAPYLLATNGHYVAAVPGDRAAFAARYADAGKYGHIDVVAFGPAAGALVPGGTADLVLTARNFHDWMWTPGLVAKYLADFHAALAPHAILAVEEHRADPRPMIDNAHDGYVPTKYLVGEVEGAGFRLEASSEINANPKDTKDYPFGVWTLPPTRRTQTKEHPTPDGFDPKIYDAIGESDRMTLRFRRV
jgi:predicted methyltransferase